MFFPSSGDPAAALPAVGPGVEAAVVRVRRPDGKVRVSYDARPAGAAEGGPVVLFLHGNAGDIALRAWMLGDFVRGTGARVLMAGYSGFGGNTGSPSEREVVLDGLAAFDHLVAEGIPPGRIVLYGESIGGAVAMAVAAEREPGGVVLQSSFTSLSSMALRVYPWLPLTALLVRGSFPSAARMEAFAGPILVVHGDRDSIVPYREGRALADAGGARAELLTVPGADHNDLLDVAGAPYLRLLRDRFHAWTE